MTLIQGVPPYLVILQAFPDALQRPDFLGQARSLECAVRSGGQPERRLEELELLGWISFRWKCIMEREQLPIVSVLERSS